MRIAFTTGYAALAALLALGACSNPQQAGGAAGSEAAAKMPKAGLWEIKTTAMGVATPPMQVCMGETKPGENPFVQKQAASNCAKNNVTATANGYDIDMECAANGMTIATKGSVTGDFTSSYKVEMATKMSGANIPAAMQKETTTTMEAKYVGACPDGMKANEVKVG